MKTMSTDDATLGCTAAASTADGCLAAGGTDGVLRVYAMGAAGTVLLRRVACVGGPPSALLWLPSSRALLAVEPRGPVGPDSDVAVGEPAEDEAAEEPTSRCPSLASSS